MVKGLSWDMVFWVSVVLDGAVADRMVLLTTCALVMFRVKVSCITFKNLFILSLRISSYGCTREVWGARKMRKSSSRRSREQV